MSMKNSNETIGNQARDLPACSAVPQPTAPQRVPLNMWLCINHLLDFHPNFIPHKIKYGFEIITQDGHLQRVTIPEAAYVQSASLTS
jgi:hypothetical protein